MAEVKVPKLLHLRPISKQKEWYKANKMPLPSHLSGGEGKSAAQAKKDVGEINKAKAKEDRLKVIAAAAKKVIKPSSERVRAMRHNADYFGGGLVGGLDRNRDIIGYVRAGGTIKAGRLGEEVEQIDEVSKADLRNSDAYKKAMANIRQNRLNRDYGKKSAGGGMNPSADLNMPSKNQNIKVDHRTGKIVSTYREEVEQVDEERINHRDFATDGVMHPDMANRSYMKVGNHVDFYSRENGDKLYGKVMKNDGKNVHIKPQEGGVHKFRVSATAPHQMQKEEVEQVDETNGEYNKYGHIKPGSVDVDPTSTDKPPVYKTNKKPAQYKPQKEEADAVKMARGIAFDKRYKGGNMTGALNAIRKVGTKLKYKNLENHPKVKSALKAANEETEMKYIEEKLTAADPASKWISDFVKSDNPKFAGKSKKERIQMALGAKYASMRKEEVEQIDELKASTLGSYMSKASKDEVARKEQGKEVQAKFKEAGMKVGVPYDRKLHSKTASRAAGKAMALKKLTGAAKVAANEAAEGKTPETSTEVELAKKHGDPKKITYGDVIKARIEAAKKKAVNKGE